LREHVRVLGIATQAWQWHPSQLLELTKHYFIEIRWVYNSTALERWRLKLCRHKVLKLRASDKDDLFGPMKARAGFSHSFLKE
jgi:hypothetical protein